MGCGGSSPVDHDYSADDAASKALEARLLQEQKEEDAITKLLVLGTGESGKSTVFKQMKILYAVPDPPGKFVVVCRANLFGNAHVVFAGMMNLGISFATPEGEAAAEMIKTFPSDGNGDVTPACVEAFATVYKDGGVQEAISLKKTEYVRLIDTANAPIFGVDTEGKVTVWNKCAANLTGYTDEDTMGHNLVQGFITEDFRSSVREVLNRALQGEETANFEFPLLTKHGTRIEILLNATPRRDEHGFVIGVVGIGQDITARIAQVQ